MPIPRRNPPTGTQTARTPRRRIEVGEARPPRDDAVQLARLLREHGRQRTQVRPDPTATLALALRIIASLPASAQRRRRLLARALAQLEAQHVARLHAFVLDVRRADNAAGGRGQQRPRANPHPGPRVFAEASYRLFFTDRVPSDAPAVAPMPSADEILRRHHRLARIRTELDLREAQAQRTYSALMARLAAGRAG